MEMLGFDHVNVRTSRLDEMIAWYTDVLNLRSGPRPAFPFGGAWMYLGDHAIVHLVDEASDPANSDPKIEHFALRAKGLSEFLNLLDERGIESKVIELADVGITQVNVFDPDGNHIHVDFKGEIAP